MKIGVIGDGGWGTALALLLHGKGHSVTVWGKFPDYTAAMRERRENFKFLPGVELPQDLRLTNSFRELVDGADLFVSAVPTQFVRGVAEEFASHYTGRPVVSVSKGLERETHLRPTQVLEQALGGGARLCALSGPSHAEEVARGIPTAVSAAADDESDARLAQETFTTGRFRVYRNPDLPGVEMGGALKNVIALAAGMCDGLGFGDNTKSALLARGLVEMIRLGAALGARRETFFGLAGVGDLMTTSFSRHGRNRHVGERIGAGETLEEVLSSMEKVAEGVWTAESVVQLARKTDVSMPISEQVYAVLHEGRSPAEAVKMLMSRPLKSEYEDLAL